MIARSDAPNLTGITDQVTSANTQTFGHSSATRLTSASGVYGTQSWIFDGVGNRTSQTATPIGGTAATDNYTYPTTSNLMQSVVRTAVTQRSFTYDGAGNIATEARSGTTSTSASDP